MRSFKKVSWLIAAAVFLAGCSVAARVNKDYAGLNRTDGVDEKEAGVIARHALLNSQSPKRFHINKASILSDRLVEPYPDYFFVSFYPVAFDDHFWRYLVVIDKKTGQVVREDQYRPLKNFNYEWVFNGGKPR
ncbi:MAG TPA: hypothetical protein PLT76_08070 [Candidatus Omnitrophota bacterium]|nr:hypothetical protein [Candidatus Omnitrophota bacterium]HQP11155.1 hypothetical protein [Candidatus Omnitrophota bacterium]